MLARVEVPASPLPGEDPTSLLIRALAKAGARWHPPPPPPPAPSPEVLAWYRLAHREWGREQTALAAVERVRSAGRRLALWALVGGLATGAGLCALAASVAG